MESLGEWKRGEIEIGLLSRLRGSVELSDTFEVRC